MENTDIIQLLLKVNATEAKKIDKITGYLAKQKAMLKLLSKERDKAFQPKAINQYSKAIGHTKNNIEKLTTEVEKSTKGFLGLGQTLGYTAKKVAMWTISTGMIYGTLRALKSGIATISMVDSKMVDLQKVFIGTSGELKMLKADIMDESIAMGSLIDTTMDAAIELGRMGKTRTEISTLMRTSLLAQNIAEIEASDATKYLNAAILQFNKIADDSITILDQWNQLSNQMPVRTIDFAQAVSATGSVMQQAGAEIEDLNAYVATLSASMAKSGREIGQALKTITSYAYRPATRVKIKDILDIDVKDIRGNLIDIDELLLRVASSWDTLRESEQEELAQSIAGVRRKAFFLSLMENFDLVLEAHAKQWDAAGSAYQENEIRLSSLKTKVEQLQAALQKLSVQGGDTGLLGLMKKTIDNSRILVENFEDMNGTLQILATVGIPITLTGIALLMKKITFLNAIMSVTMGKLTIWIAVIGGTLYGLNKLSKALAGNAAKLREQRREIEKSIDKIRIQKQEQKALIDQYELYKQAFDVYDELRKKGEDTTEAEKNLKKVLEEINKLNPELVESTDSYTKSLKRFEGWVNKARKAIEELTRTELERREESILAGFEFRTDDLRRSFNLAMAEFSGEWEDFPGLFKWIPDFAKWAQPILGSLGLGDEFMVLTENEMTKFFGRLQKTYQEDLKALPGDTIDLLKEKYGKYDKVITELTRKRTDLHIASKGQLTDEIKAVDTVLNLLQEQKSDLKDLINIRKRVADIGKPKPSELKKPEDWVSSEDREALMKLEESHALAMAKLRDKELEYWRERLRTHKYDGIVEEQEIKNRIEYLVVQKKIKDETDTKREKEKEALKILREQKKILNEQKRIYERINEEVRKAQLQIDTAMKLQSRFAGYDLTRSGAYALLDMPDYGAGLRRAKAKKEAAYKGIGEVSGGLIEPRTITSLKDIKLTSEWAKANLFDEDYKELGRYLGDLSDSFADIEEEQKKYDIAIQEGLETEKLRKQLIADEAKYFSDEQLIQEQIKYYNELILEDKTKIKEIEDSNLSTEEKVLIIESLRLDIGAKNLGILKLQNEQDRIAIQQKRRIHAQIVNTLNQVIRDWSAGRRGAEVGADFAEGMGEAIGLKLATELGKSIAGEGASLIGNLIGNTILPSIGGTLGSLIFGEIGKLIGWEREEPKSRVEEALEENTRALRENTQTFQDFQERFINAPIGFVLPPAARGSLPRFQNEGVVKRTGGAIVHKDEVILRASNLERILSKRGEQTISSSQVNSTAMTFQFGNININNPSSNLDIKRGLESGMNEIFNGGMLRYANVSSEY